MSSTFWDSYAAIGYDALCALLPYERLQETVVDAAALTPEDRVFVAGCGTGNFEAFALRRFPQLTIDAVDFSPQMLARAQAKCTGHASVHHQQADLCAPLPFATACFDIAVMCNVMYALPDAPAALRELGRVVRPGGRLVLCDRHPWSRILPVARAHAADLRALPPGARTARWLRTLGALPLLLGVAGANVAIQRRYTQGAYAFHALEDIPLLLRTAGFAVVEQSTVYADQCWLIRAERIALASEESPPMPSN